LQQSISTKEWMTKAIYDSRAKDYSNPFRKMVYANTKEMNLVTGSFGAKQFYQTGNRSIGISTRKEVKEIISKMKL